MDGYRVDLHRLADIVDQIRRFDQHLETALADADARVSKLHTTWTGEAAIAHRQAYDQWQRAVAEMRAGLAVMRRNASTAHTNYSNAVITNAGMWEQAR